MNPDLPLIPTPRSATRTTGVHNLADRVACHAAHPRDVDIALGPILDGFGVGLAHGSDPSVARLRLSIDAAASAHPEGYRLEIDPNHVSASAPTRDGLRHALRTLAQIIRSQGRTLPCLRIEDAPSFDTRGVMLDISRDKVPTTATLRWLIDALASLKINHLQLYTEHAFAYTGHEPVWEHASPPTPDEARELDAYCAERGITLTPNQNSLGHMERWLNHPAYAHLAETHDEFTFHTEWGRSITRRGPFSLCPTDPRSIGLIDDLLAQLLPCFSVPLCNIGCDEAHDVGHGRSAGAVGARGPLGVYLDHLSAVDSIVKRHGGRSLFWADMILRHPPDEWRAHLPDGAVPLLWGYEADTPFDEWCTTMRRVGLDHWVCPGTSSWRSIVGRTSVRRANIAAAARAGAASGASGFLVTDWGDLGHRQHLPVSLHSLAHGAHAAWNAEGADAFDPAAASLHLFGSEALGPLLDDLGDADHAVTEMLSLRNTNALFTELERPLDPPADPTPSVGALDDWEPVRQRLAELRSRLEAALEPCEPLVRDEIEHTLRVAEHAADKAVITRAALRAGRPNLPGPARIRLAADMASILEEHRELWPRRNRPGGLDDSARYYERLIDDYEGIPRGDT